MAHDARLYAPYRETTEIERAHEPQAREQDYDRLLERCERLERERDSAQQDALGTAYLMVGILVGLLLIVLACLA